jgi:plasmid maintenance system antidote protein VapI
MRGRLRKGPPSSYGNSAEFWMRLQAGYHLAVAEREVDERVAREVEVA